MGIIGMGDMGKMYARRIAAAGWRYALPPPTVSFGLCGCTGGASFMVPAYLIFWRMTESMHAIDQINSSN